jgi:hypothetical protein
MCVSDTCTHRAQQQQQQRRQQLLLQEGGGASEVSISVSSTGELQAPGRYRISDLGDHQPPPPGAIV